MHLRITLFFLLLFSFSTRIQAQFIEVQDGASAGISPEELAFQILQNNDFTVTNITYEGAPVAIGSFLGSEVSPIGINHGMVLTTGSIVQNGLIGGIEGVATDFASTDNESVALSENLIQLSSFEHFDVANLIIEFVPNTDTLTVDLVFGSEEYPDFVGGGFNDVFGLFLTGPGISGPFSDGGENIAFVPNTDTYISINTINENTNAEYYVTNVDAPISLNAFTTVIPVRYPVIPFETYTMTLSIADAGDSVFDSATFLQFSDCTSGFCNFFNPAKALIPENCEPANVYLDLSNAPVEVFPFEVSLSGNAINGTDYETLSESFILTADNPILDFDIIPINDTEVEGIENIELSVSSNGEYVKSVFYYLNEESDLEVVATDNCGTGVEVSISEPASVSTIYEFENSDSMLIAPFGTMVNSIIEVSGLPYSELFSTGLIKEVCVNIEHNWTSDIDLYLVSPTGQSLTLSTDNGQNGNDYTNTCFSPTATTNITNGAEFASNLYSPFTGKWQPEGVWSNLANTSANGTWTLQVKDDAVGFTGSLLSWSISFHESILSSESIIWSNGETGLSFDYTGELPLNISAEITNSNCGTPFTFNVNEVEEGVSLSTIEEISCDPNFFILVDGNVYDIDNPTGEVIIENGSYTGCDSVINVSLTFLEPEEDVYMSEDYIAGGSVTVEGNVYFTPGFYTIPVENQVDNCSYNIELSFLPIPPTYDYDVVENEETTEINCQVGGEYCFNLQSYDSGNYELITESESIGFINDFPTCTVLSERRFDIPVEVYDESRVWTITNIGGSAVSAGYFSGADQLLQHLDFLFTSAQFFSVSDIAVPKIITRASTDIETITILDVNDMTEVTMTGELAEIATGVLVPLTGTETQITVINPTTLSLSSFNLDVSVTAETNESITVLDEILTSMVINPINIEAAPDELCGAPISATIACNDDEIIDINVVLNDNGTATITGTAEAIAGTNVDICVEFCDIFGNCDTDTYIVSYDLVLGTNEVNSLSQLINIFPNPTQSEFTIRLDDTQNNLNSVGIFFLNGQEIRQNNLNAQEVINVSDLATGVYLLKIETEKGLARKRLVIMD